MTTLPRTTDRTTPAGWPLGLLALSAALGLLLTTAPAGAQTQSARPHKLPKAEEILDQAVAAQGGRAALEKLHSRVMKAKFEIVGQGQGTLVSYEQAPNMKYSKLDFPGMGTQESGTDGKVFWEIHPMFGPRVLEGAEQALSAREAVFNSMLHWRKLYTKFETVGVEQVGDRSACKVKLTPKEGGPETVYYDRKTHLPVKTAAKVPTPMGDIAVEVLMEDYRKVDGVLLPHKLTQTLVGLGQSYIITVERYEHNVDIPAERFALPAAVQALLEQPKTTKDTPGTDRNTP